MNNLGGKIQDLRKSKGITQSQLGESLGMSQKNTSAIETGKINMDLDTLQQTAKFLGVNIDYFLTSNDDVEKEVGNLSNEEIDLVLTFRLLPRKKQKAFLIH